VRIGRTSERMFPVKEASHSHRRDLWTSVRRTFVWMLAIAMRSGLVAAIVLSGAVAGCGGNDVGTGNSRGPRSLPAVGAFRKLESRQLDLPSVDLHGRTIRKYGIAGRCFKELEVGAIALPAIPGEATLGPWPGEAELKRGPVYGALLAGPPRIVYLSPQATIGASHWRAVKTIWVSRPSYDGPVLVRGGRLDRPGDLGFGSSLRARDELRLPAGSWRGLQPGRLDARPGWRTAAIPTRIRAPGCYGFQVDGLGFSYVLPFGVQLR
jgi:hypothetical protein